MRPIIRDALDEHGRDVATVLRLLGRCDEGPEEGPAPENGGEKAENDKKEAQNDGKS